MSDDIPYRPRRRRSMDTLSTLDTPAPPYGLVDPTYRPGSIRSIVLVPSADERPPSPMRSGYRMRVGQLDIRLADRWHSGVRHLQIIELHAVDRVLSPEMIAIIASFEDVIKRGHTILSLLEPFYTMSSVSDIVKLCYKLRTLLKLCITVGAALCEYEGTVPPEDMKWLTRNMSWICDSLLQDAIEKAQQLGLSDAVRAAPGGLPSPTAQERRVVESWARDMNKEHGKNIDIVMGFLTEFNFQLQLKRFDE